MKLGTFMMPLHPPSRIASETLLEDREAIILADRLGYSEAYVGEHVTDLAENVKSCLMFLSSLAFDTHQIKLGSGTINMPNGHPAAIAANVAMLDHMLKGRFIMGISPGGLASDAEVFGNFGRDRLDMFVEAIDMVMAIWKCTAPYDLQGKYFNISTARTMIPEIGQGIILKPYQLPHPPIVVTAVAPFSKGITAAASRGWDLISANFLLPQWVASHWPSYVEGCAQAGRPADPAQWRVAKSIFVTDDDDALARRYGHSSEGPYYFYFRFFTKNVFACRGRLNHLCAVLGVRRAQNTPSLRGSARAAARSGKKSTPRPCVKLRPACAFRSLPATRVSTLEFLISFEMVWPHQPRPMTATLNFSLLDIQIKLKQG